MKSPTNSTNGPGFKGQLGCGPGGNKEYYKSAIPFALKGNSEVVQKTYTANSDKLPGCGGVVDVHPSILGQ
jgi:hypothetical protein